jgi:hypothetical protein
VAVKENRNGSVAEWLGRALQKLLQRFESARNLMKTAIQYQNRGFLFPLVQKLVQIQTRLFFPF